MDALLRKRRALKGRITRIETKVYEYGNDEIPSRIAEKYKPMLDQLQTELDELYIEINELCDNDSFEVHQEEYDTLMNRIEEVHFKLPEEPDRNHRERRDEQGTMTPSSTHVRLPRLELPVFGGNYYEWTSFLDLFTATIVTNEHLTGAQKLQYLKASLKGEAAALVQSLQVTDDNFEEAWAILKGRYHNKREIINAHLKRLCSQPTLVSESPIALRQLIDTTNETVRSLRVLDAPVDYWDIILVYLVSERLDADSRRQWELSVTTTEVVKYTDFIAYLEQRARALMTCTQTRSKNQTKPQLIPRGHGVAAYYNDICKDACAICKEKHAVYKCPEMLEGTLEGRRTIVKNHNLCFNCLSNRHQCNQCRAGECKKCGGRHHTLLHRAKTVQPAEHPNTTATSHNVCLETDLEPVRVLLGTAVIEVQDSYGQPHLCRSLLDSGSQATFISEQCAQLLGLKRTHANITVKGISETATKVSRGAVNLIVTSRLNVNAQYQMEAFVLNRLTSIMPLVKHDPTQWSHLPKKDLADPKYHEPGTIDILFGADVLAEVLLEGLIKGPAHTPIAQETTFGWLISGKTRTGNKEAVITVNTAQVELDNAVRKFWEIEEIPRIKPLTIEETACEEHFTNTHHRDSNGRFIVRLPFKNTEVLLNPSETKHIAIRRMNQVTRNLSVDESKRRDYHSFMEEYETLRHMEIKSPCETSIDESIYLPHHAVIKESSTTTRLRVVFDASAKCKNGMSLNDHLMVGPTLQDDMFAILLRFRTHVIAMTADISKMYRQILVDKADTKFQNIVWREGIQRSLQEYRLLTLTYGMAPASFLATRCLHQLATEAKHESPYAASIVKEDFYMDDLISGAEEETNAIKLQKELTTLLLRGGFELRKWASNSSQFLELIPTHLRQSEQILRLDDDETVHTLGLRWAPKTDVFLFDLTLGMNSSTDTKRSLLSAIAKIFDPLGWLAPVTIRAKLLLQDLWRSRLNWDDNLPKDTQDAWTRYQMELQDIRTVRIPRPVVKRNSTNYQLHGFCDASEKAYAAAVYLRVQYVDEATEVHLLTAKTRVAPLKFVTLPRLELCGAMMLADLMQSVKTTLRIPISTTKAWTDSTITLAWINACSTRWKTFVANRVSQIQDKLPAVHWNHIPGLENPVDCASRGISPQEIEANSTWWHGPAWLKEDYSHLLTKVDVPDVQGYIPTIDSEERIVVSNLVKFKDPMFTRYSSLFRLTRITAYIFRFLHNAKVDKLNRRTGVLSCSEVNLALRHWIIASQIEEFKEERNCLLANRSLHAGSKLLSLNPFLDIHGVIRVGGRLRHADTTVEHKFPAILPRKHELTMLVVRQEHLRNLHAGPQLLLSTIQQRYWIIGGRDLVRQFVRNCVVCHRFKPVNQRPVMGDLPAARINVARPFLRSGVDYAGPITLRALKLRGQKTYKAYIALFVCFTTHAIHLEVVSDMTSAAFIAALKRFIARRGLCSDIYSDQGTTFVGANKDLREFLRFTRGSKHNQVIETYLSTNCINWHFNPPAAPHFGGLWEAGVKSMKYHLRRIVGNVPLNYEELSTVLTQIEAMLNSRPLCASSNDPSDLTALTPGHFLIGTALNTLPEPNYLNENLSHLSRWQLLQRLSQHFWKRWSTEYLTSLQPRPKAGRPTRALRINDLVLLQEENIPPTQWKLGRVIRLHPGKDGHVRVINIRTQTGEFLRPVVKVSRLPINE